MLNNVNPVYCTQLNIRIGTLSLRLIFLQLRYLIAVLFLITSLQPAKAQRIAMNMPEHDDKVYYFGITFGLNFSQYKIHYSNSFTNTDTFKSINSKYSPGFNLGLMGNLRLNKRFDLRTVPSLAFAEKNVQLNMTSSQNADSSSSKPVESIYLHIPIQLKFKSDRINNFRFYAIGGGKFDFDLAANSRSKRPDEFIKVKPFDMGYELGVGFEFYYPNFIFSPEIKLSQGLMNQLYHDSKIPLTNAIDGLNTRMIVISIHLEG